MTNSHRQLSFNYDNQAKNLPIHTRKSNSNTKTCKTLIDARASITLISKPIEYKAILKRKTTQDYTGNTFDSQSTRKFLLKLYIQTKDKQIRDKPMEAFKDEKNYVDLCLGMENLHKMDIRLNN